MKLAIVFPGQGAQEVGMGRAMATADAGARAVFEAVDAALGDTPLALSTLCFEGPAEALTLTANTQPAILATSLACLSALRTAAPSLRPVVYAGHSLGEYSALVAAGALDLTSAARLLRLRGEAMQAAVAPGEGSMAAILMLDDAVVAALCEEVSAAMPGRVVQPANFNAPGQVVVAGHADAVARVGELADARRGKAMALKVSAPFHCALMNPAAVRLEAALAGVTFGAFEAPVVANVDAASNDDPSRAKELLVRQVAGAVRWADSVRAMVAAGVEGFIEVGPGRVLSGLIKRIHKGANLWNVSDPASLAATVEGLRAKGAV
jgi:[acyl-carrier-protein] S-malonyltransferase